MRDLTEAQAWAEARRRWGLAGAVRARPPAVTTREGARGRLARYRFVVGNANLGKGCTVQGQGDTWRAAFDDAGGAR